jgi:anti-sigma B factor antagonist
LPSLSTADGKPSGSIKKFGGVMSLNVKTRKVGTVVVIDLSGRLTIGEPVLLLRETLRKNVSDGVRQFVLNLGDVSYIDSSGLGELVSVYTTVRNKQGDVKLLNLTAKAKDLLQMTKLLTVFDVYEDEAKAITALQASSSSPA